MLYTGYNRAIDTVRWSPIKHTLTILKFPSTFRMDSPPLMIAAFTGHYKIVELLMGADANIDTQDMVCSLYTD